jgi:Cof subfamily protein (haloacid dehalogenase superfamily)
VDADGCGLRAEVGCEAIGAPYPDARVNISPASHPVAALRLRRGAKKSTSTGQIDAVFEVFDLFEVLRVEFLTLRFELFGRYGVAVPLGLVCLDVDGTLVGHSGSPTDGVWAAADRARADGIHLAICTARLGSGSAWDWATRLDPDGWHMFQTGASIMHTNTGATRSTPLPTSAVREGAAIAAERGWVFEVYSDTDYIVDDAAPVAVAHAGLLGMPFVQRGLVDLAGTPLRIQYIVTDADVDQACLLVPAGCVASSATSPIIPGYHFVSITDAAVSKASGVRALADILGLSLDQVMMVGDGQNDVSALQVAGHPVAMGNGHADAKAVAKHIVADVEHDGVAEALDLARTLS